jgi:hypothetical protein
MSSCLEIPGSVLFLKYCPTDPILNNGSIIHTLERINSRSVLILFSPVSLDLAGGLGRSRFPINLNKV